MKVTTNYIEQKFCEFNEMIFGGKLPPLPIKLSSARTFMGKLRYEKKRKFLGGWAYKNYQLVISTRFDVSEHVIEDTVIHEMIHYYIMYRGLRDTSSHGPVFRKMMKEINDKYGRHVSVSVRLDAEIQKRDTKKRCHLLCVSHFKDGRVGVTVAAHTRWQYLREHLPHIPNVTDCIWYVTSNPFFNKFPRALTAKIYLISKTEIAENLADAEPMEWSDR